MDRVVILDGYTDEPAGLGVPPYLDVYPRYVAGAVWSVDKSIDVKYFTIDQVRSDWASFVRVANEARVLIVIAGIVTPGKYLGGEPIRLEEIERIANIITKPIKILGGPVARFGYGSAGGTIAIPRSRFQRYYDLVVTGDVDLVTYELLRNNYQSSKVSPALTHIDYGLINKFAVLGAHIVTQHPNYGRNLIIELETYKSCPRYISGGCSFCATVRYGPVKYRDAKAIVEEVKALYSLGVRHFRLGRQADFYAYMAHDTGKLDFPRPNPEAIESLLVGIRNAAPELETLHIDNVNPGTIYHWPRESVEVTKTLMKYHTPGDVAAMGIETADPRVVKLNNLKVMPDEAYFAVKTISELGRVRGWNGMPELLPGINFVIGLPGETRETFRLNIEFLKKLLDNDVWVRRVNIRQVLVLPPTPLWSQADDIKQLLREHRRYFLAFKYWVRRYFDHEMLRKVVPKSVVLRRVFTEVHYGDGTYARQVGSYPLLIYIPAKIELGRWIDVVVSEHGFRSVIGVPYPVNVNEAPKRLLKYVPSMSRDVLNRIIAARPIRSYEQLKSIIGGNQELIKYLAL
ncbi:radical SAM protein [Vulcanisaeta distributa]|uniref:Radical SAM domain protein n=1 Tax=Vulcanisaeta distributa (strain DSM 14429 / JCM 11212 / NBRC 100878 / IC-017) TaxID=572478 RepID=E1QPZ8_VULDI|nr:radical SAM protein [Vulcanisaeta distributa]ADN50370.1 Radical SAM domain protein [Vulcanisaeta distributa DSM 14429]